MPSGRAAPQAPGLSRAGRASSAVEGRPAERRRVGQVSIPAAEDSNQWDLIPLAPNDCRLKQGFAAIDVQEVLTGMAALPLSTWRYKVTPDVRHIGPLAQDVHPAFGLGRRPAHRHRLPRRQRRGPGRGPGAPGAESSAGGPERRMMGGQRISAGSDRRSVGGARGFGTGRGAGRRRGDHWARCPPRVADRPAGGFRDGGSLIPVARATFLSTGDEGRAATRIRIDGALRPSLERDVRCDQQRSLHGTARCVVHDMWDAHKCCGIIRFRRFDCCPGWSDRQRYARDG